MKSLPMVSVIVPAFNAENTVLRALNSLRLQNFSHTLEVIIINDGSSDSTSQVVNSFIKDHKLNWIFITQENAGEANARNTGLSLFRGKYLLFLDADDELHHDAIDLLVKKSQEQSCDIVFSSYSKVFSENKCVNYLHKNKNYTVNSLMKKFFQRRITIGIGNSLIRGDIVRNNRIFFADYKSGTDNHFFRNYLRFCRTGASIDNVLFYYYVNVNSVMTSVYSEKRIDSILSVLDTKKTLLSDNVPDEIISSLDVFLINEIRGNVIDFCKSNVSLSFRERYSFINDKILIYMPKNVNLILFLNSDRFLWGLFNLFFYFSPLLLTTIHFILFKLRRSCESNSC